MKAVLLHVKHVQKPVIPVLNIAKETLKWNNAKNYAGLAPMPAENVQKHARTWMLMQHTQHSNVLMPAGPVRKNVKSIIMNNVSVVLKNAESAKQNAERLQFKINEGF